MMDKAVMTIATGKPIYLKMAVNLARSFKVWHSQSSIRFVLVTDQKRAIPSDLSDIEVIEIKPGEYGKGFVSKLHLDIFAPAKQTLFIDSDCLCVGPLEPVFDKFKGRAVSVIGDIIKEGNCWGDVSSICRAFKIDWLPKFVGGIYYLEKGDMAKQVFASARRLESKYDEAGLLRLRGMPNEEPLVAIAMAMHGQKPITEDGSIKADLLFYPSKVKVDVFGGKASLWNLPESRKYNHHWPLRESRPLVVHFNCSFAERRYYAREAVRLEKVMSKGWPLAMASLYADITQNVPELVVEGVKDLLRPGYRRLLGTREVKKSNRL